MDTVLAALRLMDYPPKVAERMARERKAREHQASLAQPTSPGPEPTPPISGPQSATDPSAASNATPPPAPLTDSLTTDPEFHYPSSTIHSSPEVLLTKEDHPSDNAAQSNPVQPNPTKKIIGEQEASLQSQKKSNNA